MLQVNNSQVSVRSLLGYDWVFNAQVDAANAKASIHRENFSKSHTDVVTGPKALKGFTYFVSPNTTTSLQPEMPAINAHSALSTSQKHRHMRNRQDAVHFARLQDTVGVEEDDDDLNYLEETEEKHCVYELERERYLNVL